MTTTRLPISDTTSARSTSDDDEARCYETDLPARLDRLPWGRFHTLLVIALGITWLLDGLEVTLAGSVAGALKDSPALRLSKALGIDALASSTPSTRFRSFHTSWRFLAQEIYFFHRDLFPS